MPSGSAQALPAGTCLQASTPSPGYTRVHIILESASASIGPSNRCRRRCACSAPLQRVGIAAQRQRVEAKVAGRIGKVTVLRRTAIVCERSNDAGLSVTVCMIGVCDCQPVCSMLPTNTYQMLRALVPGEPHGASAGRLRDDAGRLQCQHQQGIDFCAGNDNHHPCGSAAERSRDCLSLAHVAPLPAPRLITEITGGQRQHLRATC